jgi:LysM repeat protein
VNKFTRTLIITFVLVALLALQIAAVQPAAAAGICTQTHLVQRGETLYRIARTYGTTVSELQRINGMGTNTRIYSGSYLCVSYSEAPSGTAYVVQRGDTLSAIARRFGVDMNVLARVNNIINVNRIYTGMTLMIPDVTIQ